MQRVIAYATTLMTAQCFFDSEPTMGLHVLVYPDIRAEMELYHQKSVLGQADFAARLADAPVSKCSITPI